MENNNVPFVEGFENPPATGFDDSQATGFSSLPKSWDSNTAAVKRSRAPIVITLVCMFLAGALTAGALFFLTNAGSSYERAERNSLNAFANGFSSFLPEMNMSGSVSVTITPSKELATLIPGIPDIGSIGFSSEIIIDGTDMFTALGLSALGVDVSVSMWSLGEQLIIQFPEISQYYIAMMNMGDVIMQMPDIGIFSDVDTDAIYKELGEIGRQVFEHYFELTKDVQATHKEEVSAGDLSKMCDFYRIIIDEEFLCEIFITALEAYLESDEIMRVSEQVFAYFKEDFPWLFGNYKDFEDLLEYGLDELYDVLDEGDFGDNYIEMLVYVSGKDIIRRDIVIDDVTFSYVSITEGADYAKTVKLSQGRESLSYSDIGKTERGESTGTIKLSYGDRRDSYSLTIKYRDFKVENNGLFSGTINVDVPIPGENFGVELSLKSTVAGDSQKITGSLSVFGLRAVDLEINYSTNSGKSITPPNMTAANTLDPENEDDIMTLVNDFSAWLFGLADLDIGLDFIDSLEYLIEDLIWEFSYMTGMWEIYDALSGSSNSRWADCPPDCDYWCCNDDYWDNYWDCPPDCDDWCCNDDYWDNYWDDYDNWSNYDFYDYIVNYYKGLWKLLIGRSWNEALWNDITEIYKLDLMYFEVEDWIEVLEGFGYNIGALYYEVEAVMNNIDDDVLYSYFPANDEDMFAWSAEQWENFWRGLLNNSGFNF
ncbi:MAG: DUF515 domain-containing protein [Oscillospiraceae bacterium]|jgi:hypothetical protein|nr:DUF515 domain-containing protein [Oscillospiraceae bacterium]